MFAFFFVFVFFLSHFTLLYNKVLVIVIAQIICNYALLQKWVDRDIYIYIYIYNLMGAGVIKVDNISECPLMVNELFPKFNQPVSEP